ncbi:MAG: hypothetical protein AB1714_06505 [Acidobacteriota bacterium]
MRTLVLIAAAPPQVAVTDAMSCAEAALARGDSTYLYLYDEGVLLADSVAVQSLANRGAHVYACFESSRRRRVEIRSERVLLSGLVSLAGLIEGCDRLEAFT